MRHGIGILGERLIRRSYCRLTAICQQQGYDALSKALDEIGKDQAQSSDNNLPGKRYALGIQVIFQLFWLGKQYLGF
jgi:hypothetical protein